MAEQAVYVPHCLGTVIGSRQTRPWLCRDAQHGIDRCAQPTWPGQPVFATAPDAFAWLDWARDQHWLPEALSVAHIDVHTDLTAEGVRRLHVGAVQLREAGNQILRPHPTANGPDLHVLAACHGLARAEAMRTWLLDTVGATASDRRHAALSAVWTYGYQLAARDGRTAAAGQVARAVRDLLAEPTANATSHDGTAELRCLDQALTLVAAAAAMVGECDLPAEIQQQAGAAERHAGHIRGWDAALAFTWKEALRLGALRGATEAAGDIETLWRTDPATRPGVSRIQARRSDQWLADLLLDTNRAIASQWLLVTATPLTPPAPQPDAAQLPVPPAQRASDGSTVEPGTNLPPPSRAFPAPAAGPDRPPSVPPGSAREPHGRRR